MFIKSIVIDGFKSYAKRTEITGFDPAFNAITGLNGSGKSNILDAICFLLGITNLSQVRANTLQDLVYKGGQAGVTKATVSIVFDNRQKSESPIGYENFDELTITRQIVMGGKNKYLINGINATNTRVHDLFRSVQLNVNNPHFLIMQGRITKVLNMKPPEILSLLEEAAATKLYETKRESTLATIDKKESKLREIEKLLREEISPKLVKLRQEHSSYKEYENISRELDYLNKFIIADRYVQLRTTVENAGGFLNALKTKRAKEEAKIVECNENQKFVEGEISEMTDKRATEDLPNYEKLDQIHSELQKQLALLNNAIKRTSESIKVATENLEKAKKEKQLETISTDKIRQQIKNIQSEYDGLKNKMKEDKLRLSQAQQRLQEVNCGLFTDESGAATASLSDLYSSAIKIESQLEIELNVLQMKVTHSEKIAREFEAEMGKLHKDDSAAQQEINFRKLQSKIEQLDQQMAGLDHSPDKYDTMAKKLLQKKQEVTDSEAEKNQLLFNNRWLKFEYTRPNQSFDDNMIKGVVASLIEVENTEFCTALQTAAGGRLFNIIVENDEVAAQLINGNCLRERKTLLPLNKMRAEPTSAHLFRTAEQIVGKNNVWSVMSLIKFDERYRTAINYVFGHCLIARDLNVAKTIAFDNRIRCKAVTLEGDVFDPEGTLVGGSNTNNSDIIGIAQRFNVINSTLTNLYNEQTHIKGEMKNVESVEEQYKVINRERDELRVKSRQLGVKMMENNYLQVAKKLSETKVELGELMAEFKTKKSLHEQAMKKTAEAKKNVENSASVKEKAQQAAENEAKESRKESEISEKKFNSYDLEYENLVMELKSNEDDEKELENSITEIANDIQQKGQKLNEEKDELQKHNEIISSSETKVKEQKKILQKIDEDVSKKRDAIKKLIATKDQAESNLEEVNHKIEMHHVDSAAAEEKLTKMVNKHAWINEEKENFGRSGSMYDFEVNTVKNAEQKVEKLTEKKQKLSRKVDMRGMNMLGPMEERYKEVTSKYNQVLQDKVKLQDVIDDLDKRKDEVLKKAHEQVDQDFDKIFSTLLPGSRARLIPPEGKTLKEGLEFKISIDDVWKESLTELSGGQRSLVALSFILALLRFKPAPLYILDDVDAALDISHTQNIGTIIKEQFSNSQFIIVSLKDGMFNNANVLYKTKFVDGVSTVSRHHNQSRRPMTEKN